MLLSVPTTTLAPPSGAPSASAWFPVLGGVLAALIGAITALTVAAITRRASERQWRVEAKRQVYTEILLEASRIVRLIRGIYLIGGGSSLVEEEDLRQKIDEYLTTAMDASDRTLEQGFLLSYDFLRSFMTLVDHLDNNVTPLIERALNYQLLGQQGSPEGLFAAYERSTDLVRNMREHAYADVGIFEQPFLRALQRYRRLQ